MKTLLRTIEIVDVGISFDSKNFAFHSLSTQWSESGNWEIVSQHGHGKSILFQIVGGMTNPSRGKVLYNGIDIFETEFEKTLSLRLQVGFGFDLGGLLHNRTLFENLMLPLEYHKIQSFSAAKELVASMFDKFQIGNDRDKRPSFVSGSTRKLTVLIRSLLLEPRFIILDDPFVGLTDSQKATFVSELVGLRKKHGFLAILFTDSTKSKLLARDGQYYLSQNQISLIPNQTRVGA